MNDKKALLSTLWIFVTLNYLYCDLIGLMDARLLRQYLTGTVDGLEVTPTFLFAAAVLMEIPIAMVLLSRILAAKPNRWANMLGAAIKTVVMVLTLFIGTFTMYYLFFAVIEIAATIFIFIYALQWKTTQTPLAA